MAPKKKTTSSSKSVAKKAASPTKAAPPSKSAASGVITIEHCKSWGAFKTRAAAIEKAVKAAGLKIQINPEKPRKGAFVVTSPSGKVLLELLDMPRPFTKLKALDMAAESAKIVKACQ